MQVLEANVLHLPLDAAHAEAVRNGGVDLKRFERDTLLFFWGDVPKGLEVVQPVGELDEHHAHVRGHREEHLAQVLDVAVHPAVLDLAELGDATDHRGDICPERRLNVLEGPLGVFGDVVQQGGRDDRLFQAHFGERIGRGERVDDVRLATGAFLAAVGFLGEDVGTAHEVHVRLRVQGLQQVAQAVDALFGRGDHRGGGWIRCSKNREKGARARAVSAFAPPEAACYPLCVLLAVLLAFVVILILGGAIFIAKAGIYFCEDSRMLKILLGGYFGLYLLAALLVAVVIPPVGGAGVDAASLAMPWSQAASDIPLSLGIPSFIKTAFGTQL